VKLEDLGWNDHFDALFEPYRGDCLVGRVGLEHQHIYRVYLEGDEPLAHVSGRFRHQASKRQDYPAVGDWVAVKRAADPRRVVIHAVLPRRSRFSRKAAGDVTEEQVVAANVDTVFLVSGLDRDYNPRRIERYLVTAREGGAEPVVLLNKADTCADVEAVLEETRQFAAGAPVHAVSARTRHGLDALATYLRPGRTIAFLGSSGVGKSTIINSLLGREKQRTRPVRDADSRGRHTTTHRELIVVPGGALLIDTPGMRELQLWDAPSGLGDAFDDIAALGERCHFRDCRHDTEPRCAVRAAVEAGELPADRYAGYLTLQRELASLARRQDQLALIEEKRKWRSIHKSMRHFKPKG
jgi:ribosome biogenesis GTPase